MKIYNLRVNYFAEISNHWGLGEEELAWIFWREQCNICGGGQPCFAWFWTNIAQPERPRWSGHFWTHWLWVDQVIYVVNAFGTRKKAKVGKHRIIRYCESFPYGEYWLLCAHGNLVSTEKCIIASFYTIKQSRIAIPTAFLTDLQCNFKW